MTQTLSLTRLRIVLLAGALLLAGIGLKTAYDVSRHVYTDHQEYHRVVLLEDAPEHVEQDHQQHHAMLVLLNELIRRDPTLGTVLVNARPQPASVDPPADESPIVEPDIEPDTS